MICDTDNSLFSIEGYPKPIIQAQGIWDTETSQICHHAALFLNNRKITDRDAVIFDIDGTLIANESRCIVPVKYLYDIARKLGYHVFIVTARAQTIGNQIFTTIMLENCGVDGYASMFMRPPDNQNLYAYKETRRKVIYDMGFNSVMSVGDMPFDFGAYGGLSVKIPEGLS